MSGSRTALPSHTSCDGCIGRNAGGPECNGGTVACSWLQLTAALPQLGYLIVYVGKNELGFVQVIRKHPCLLLFWHPRSVRRTAHRWKAFVRLNVGITTDCAVYNKYDLGTTGLNRIWVRAVSRNARCNAKSLRALPRNGSTEKVIASAPMMLPWRIAS